MVGIYKITSPSGRVYIGQTRNFKKRLSNYRNKLANEQPFLHNSFKKHGFDTHEIKMIHELPEDVTQKVVDEYECFYIDQYRNCGFDLMNIKEGGLGGKHSERSKKLISKALSGRKMSDSFCDGLSKRMKGNKFGLGFKKTDEQIAKTVVAHIGSKRSDESKQKMRNAKIGWSPTQEHREKISKFFKGRKKSEETKKKLSEAMRVRVITESQIENMKNTTLCKPVIQLTKSNDYIREWRSTSEANRELNIDKSLIQKCANGKPHYNSAGGFKWIYKSEYEAINN